MSVVWRGYDEVLGRSVAVKVMAARPTTDPMLRERLRAEAQSAARLSHPHITNVHDYGESRDSSGECVPYVVMELLQGPTLAQRLTAGALPVQAALRICAQVATALATAHARGLVHRDVKPANVILSPAGPKVVDFGIAAAAGERGDRRSNGEIWGTPAYVAPERLLDGRVVPGSDVYALGLVLYRALAGELPWHARTPTAMLHAHLHEEPAPLPALAGLPAEVRALCHRCLAKDPRKRPTGHEVAAVLAKATGLRLLVQPGTGGNFLVDLDVPGDHADAVWVERPATGLRRRVKLALSAAVVVVAGAFAGTFGTGPGTDWSGGAGAAAAASHGAGSSGDAGRTQPAPDSAGPGTAGAHRDPGNADVGNAGTGQGGSGGAGTVPKPTRAASPVPVPHPVERSVQTLGGTVVARCVGSTATLVSWTPLPGFDATGVVRGPGEEVGLVFAGLLDEVHVTVRCVAGEPQASVRVT
jgi:serine/threonine-protein kinase